MSHHPRPTAGALASRIDIALSLDENKPDTKTFPHLGSPISPLRTTTPGTGGPAHTSSSSSSSGSFSANRTLPGTRKSGELSSGSGESSPTGPRPMHRRSGSTGPLIYSGGNSASHSSTGHTSGGASSGVAATGISSTASSPMTMSNVLPAGNICPSGKIGRSGASQPRPSTRSDVLGTGMGNYGHGSIMWGGTVPAAAPAPGANSCSFQEATRRGNDYYKRGLFLDALRWYDKAVSVSPDNASCRSNRAAALIGLGRIGEALRECEEAVRLDPTSEKAQHRLAMLNLRIGLVEIARKHFALAVHGQQQPDQTEMRKLQDIEVHSAKCIDARRIGDWKSALREADATVAAGADSSPLIFALRAEALLKLHKLDEADSTLSKLTKLESSVPASSPMKVFGMLSSSYMQIVRAQVDMALGRFDTAVAAAEKAKQLDPMNAEVTLLLNNVRLVARARLRGNELYKSGSFADACTAYGEGLKHDPFNSVLYCNRAACWSKMGRWEKSVEDCNEALRIQPNYTKALLRRANSNAKLERWAECVRDYEVLRKELPRDKEVAEGLFHAQVALKMSRGEEVSNLKFGGEVEAVSTLEQFKAAISLPGVSVVYFMAPGNAQCTQIAPFVDALCTRYPSANFLKVNVNETQAVARAENVRIVPTFKIYKNGTRVKEMICPSQQILEYSVRHYSI